mgnify:CR=1 FL=1
MEEVKNRMITYSTNWMGPINEDWIAKHGDYWAAGRIDIYGVEGEHYPLEYSLPPMHVQDWNALSFFLDRLYTHGTRAMPYTCIIGLFEAEYGKQIRWCDENI